eukprot:COSAG02_NODE_9603_length_2165_cov_2.252662_1_plen_416_part_10
MLIKMDELPGKNDLRDRFLIQAAWKDDPAEEVQAFWERGPKKDQMFQKKIASELFLPDEQKMEDFQELAAGMMKETVQEVETAAAPGLAEGGAVGSRWPPTTSPTGAPPTYAPGAAPTGFAAQAPVQRARGLHAWDEAAGAAPEDLHFAEGQEFELVSEEPGGGWYTGRINGVEGIFPSNFVEVVAVPAAAPAAGPPGYTAQAAAPAAAPTGCAPPASAGFATSSQVVMSGLIKKSSAGKKDQFGNEVKSKKQVSWKNRWLVLSSCARPGAVDGEVGAMLRFYKSHRDFIAGKVALGEICLVASETGAQLGPEPNSFIVTTPARDFVCQVPITDGSAMTSTEMEAKKWVAVITQTIDQTIAQAAAPGLAEGDAVGSRWPPTTPNTEARSDMNEAPQLVAAVQQQSQPSPEPEPEPQ